MDEEDLWVEYARYKTGVPSSRLVYPMYNTRMRVMPSCGPLRSMLTHRIGNSMTKTAHRVRTSMIHERGVDRGRRGEGQRSRQSGPDSAHILDRTRLSGMERRQERRLQHRETRERHRGASTGHCRSTHRSTRGLHQASARDEHLRRVGGRRTTEGGHRELLAIFFLLVLLINIKVCVKCRGSCANVVGGKGTTLRGDGCASTRGCFGETVVGSGSGTRTCAKLTGVCITRSSLSDTRDICLGTLRARPSGMGLCGTTMGFCRGARRPGGVSSLLRSYRSGGMLSTVGSCISSTPRFDLGRKACSRMRRMALASTASKAVCCAASNSSPARSDARCGRTILLRSRNSARVHTVTIGGGKVPDTISDTGCSVRFPLMSTPTISPSAKRCDATARVAVAMPSKCATCCAVSNSAPATSSRGCASPVSVPRGSRAAFSTVLIGSGGKGTARTAAQGCVAACWMGYMGWLRDGLSFKGCCMGFPG